MFARTFLSLVAAALWAGSATAQTTPASGRGTPAWRPPGNVSGTASPIPTTATEEAAIPAAFGQSVLKAAAHSEPARIASVTKGSGTLPNDQGQVWREYDISPYTLRVTSTNRPEQAIVDWILRETGYEAWHGETAALLSADKRTLRAYHTPAMQQVVGEIVDRFVNTRAESHAFGVQVITIGSPNWRARFPQMLRPVQVQTAGVQAWLLAKEDAATLLVELSKRTDYRTHTSPHLMVNNGQATVITLGQPRSYIRGFLPGAVPGGLQTDMGQVFEGFSLELSPLLSLDGQIIDAIVKCNVDQVEKMIGVRLEMPGVVANRQLTTVEVPQLSGTRLQERFRWPADKILLVSLGVVPSPMPGARGAAVWPLSGGPPRADMLLLIDSKGNVPTASVQPPAGPTTAGAAPLFVR